MARLFKRGRRGRYFPDQRGDGTTKKNFPATAVDTVRFSIPGWRRHHFPDPGGDSATKKTLLVTAVDTARPFIPGWRRSDFPDQGRVGAFFQNKMEIPRFSRPRQIRRDQESILAPAVDFSDKSGDCPHQGGYGANFQTRAERARQRKKSSRPRWIRRDFSYQGGDGMTFQTKAELVQLFRPKRIRRDLPDRGGESATKTKFLATAMDTARHSIPGCRRHHFPDRGGDGATFHIRCRRHHFPEQGGDGPTKKMFLATAVDTARLWRSEWIWPTPRWIRRIFQTKAETAQPRIKFLRPRRRRRVFPDQGANGATLQNRAERALLSRPTRRRRDQEKFPRDRSGYGATLHTRVETA